MKFFELKMRLIAPLVVMCCLIGAGSQVAQAQTYTSDSNLAHFTAGVSGTSNNTYAMLSHFSGGDVCTPTCPATFTPDANELANNSFRVFGGTLTGTGLSTTPTGQNWIEATFPSAVSAIIVMPNIDHFGSAFDGFQYSIAGSNDEVSWTLLYDPQTVIGTAEPFTLGTVNTGGTAPWTVNNVLTPHSVAPPAGCSIPNPPPCSVGYIAQFQFSTAYLHYAFGASTEAINAGNLDQELSAVRSGEIITQPLLGNGAVNSFQFLFALYNMIYPADKSIASGTTMTILATDLSQANCNAQIVTVQLADGTTPAFTGSCTTYPTLNSESAIFDIVCAVGAATPTSVQCPTTTGFNPFSSPPGFHSSEDISNLIYYSSPTNVSFSGEAPQVITGAETTASAGTTLWFLEGTGHLDCLNCGKGGGGSSFNSLVVSFDFNNPTTGTNPFAIPPYPFDGFASPVDNEFNPDGTPTGIVNRAKADSTIPFKWCLFYPVDAALGFNGGPVTNLNLPPTGYLSITATQLSGTGTASTVVNDIPIDTATNSGLINDGNGCYHFNVVTSFAQAGQTWEVCVDVGDGVKHCAIVTFH